MSSWSPRLITRLIMNNGLVLLIKMISVLLILYSIFGAQRSVENYDSLKYIIIYVVPLICGVLVLLDRHNSIFFAVGLYAISLGFSRAVTYFIDMTKGDFIYIAYIYLILTLMGLNLMYSGYRYLTGNSRSVRFIIMGSFFFIFVLSIDLILDYHMSITDGVRPSQFLYENRFNLVQLSLYMIYLSLAWSEEIRLSTMPVHMDALFTGYRLSNGKGIDMCADEGVLDDVERFYNKDPAFETQHLETDGRVFAQYDFTYYDRQIEGYVTMQRWDSAEGPVYISFNSHREGSMLNPMVFRILELDRVDDLIMMSFDNHRSQTLRKRMRWEHDGPVTLKEPKNEEVDDDEDNSIIEIL
ncbi:MAG: hypothetical protein E7Z64_04040 [Thermoplasmata archaeon]|nr:hypothetical protein [Thermoplasmata archaeon]